MAPITTALAAVALVVYVLYRQLAQRPVTAKDVIIPLAGGLYLGDRYLTGGSAASAALVLGAAGIGIVSGLFSGFAVRVWQDANSGAVYQKGGWSYLAVLVGLVVMRIVLKVALSSTGIIDPTNLNTAFIAMAIANYAGRAITVGLRALALAGWNLEALSKSASRRQGGARSW
ncbi:MAG TPA: CcdC protein domain-containing protein [Chloroflexota bacterium]|nr:CcdC protein domain-containing protein [Chloroflexota bacterium]